MSYKIKAVWPGTLLNNTSIKEFENAFLEFGFHIKYETEFKMNDGINCIVFGICEKEISKFTIWRITHFNGEIKWLDDFCDNERENIPIEIINKFN